MFHLHVAGGFVALACLCLDLSALARQATNDAFRISTFNIRWYGLGGEPTGLPADEFRDPWIREFLHKEMAGNDAILFQEIVDPERFQASIIKDWMTCHTYDQSNPKHLHIVLCHLPKYRFVPAEGEHDLALEAIAIDPQRHRPGLHGLLLNQNDTPIFRIVGVHLKAYAQESAVRMQQVAAMAAHLASVDKSLPTIVLGDFNTHTARLSGQSEDDWVMMDRLLAANPVDLVHVVNEHRNTFRIPGKGYHLDHIWVSKGAKVLGKAEVGGACNSDPSDTSRFDNFPFFNRFVSDHCPVTVDMERP